jgi:pectate lyase
VRKISLSLSLLLLGLGALTGGCSSGSSQSASGGSAHTGGAAATGGVTSKGGEASSGGNTTTGGVSATGGSRAAGGSVGATGGSVGATGGSLGSGGSTRTGGVAGTGGAVGTGGIATGGNNSVVLGTGGIASTGGRSSSVAVGTGGIATGGNTGVVASTGGSRDAGAVGATGGVSAIDGALSTGGVSTSGPNGVEGFAAIPGLGLDTTTGGKGGKVVTVTTLADLQASMDSNDALIILLSGTFDLGGMTPLRSNKTLIGQKGARMINGGLELYKRQNVIIRNIIFADAPDDTMKINQNTHHIWVDHCDFTNAQDGLFDITRQTSFITVSYNHFYQHSKTMLIGHSDDETADTGYLKTSVHHNWFDGTEQRHPRVRFGEVHVFNNYFLNNALYAVASTMEADVVMESNYFEGVAYPSYVGYQESGPGDLVERNNVYQGSGTPQTRGTAFDPTTYYKVTMDDPGSLPARLKAQAGAGVLDPAALLAAAQ